MARDTPAECRSGTDHEYFVWVVACSVTPRGIVRVQTPQSVHTVTQYVSAQNWQKQLVHIAEGPW